MATLNLKLDLTTVDKYSFLPAHKLTESQIKETINELLKTNILSQCFNRLYKFRTLLKYPYWMTPSAMADYYSAYSFPGNGISYYNCISFVTDIPHFQVFVKHAKIPIFPYKGSVSECLSASSFVEKMSNFGPEKCIGACSFNPEEGTHFFVMGFDNNPVTSAVLSNVIGEMVILKLLKIPFSPGDENGMKKKLSDVKLIAPLHIYLYSQNNTITRWLPSLLMGTHTSLGGVPFQCVDINQKKTVIGLEFLIEKEFRGMLNYSSTLEKILRESQKKNGIVILWFEHDELGKPVEIGPENISNLLKWIEFYDRHFPVIAPSLYG